MLPNLIIMAPADENECRQMLKTAYEFPGPALVRYPRGGGPGVAIDPAAPALPIGQGTLVRSGTRVALLAFGSMVTPALVAAAELDATLANMRFVKPLDGALLQALAAGHELLVTVEENSIAGGAGSGVAEWLAAQGLDTPCVHLGLPDRDGEHAEHAQQLDACGLDGAGISAAVRDAYRRRFPERELPGGVGGLSADWDGEPKRVVAAR